MSWQRQHPLLTDRLHDFEHRGRLFDQFHTSVKIERVVDNGQFPLELHFSYLCGFPDEQQVRPR